MKNKIIYLWMLMGCLWAACSDEPVFPDPGFDATKDIHDTIRRDTIKGDVYYLKMKINAPNGINTVQILNGLNYQEMDRLDEYKGQTDFTMNYPIDLKNVVEKDSTMHFIVRVIDNDMRAYNKAFVLTVKPFSTPTITFPRIGGKLGLASSVFELKAHFETGLKHIRNYRISFEDEIIEEKEMGDTLSDYLYRKVLNLKMQKDRDYNLTVRLTDDEGTSKEKVLVLKLIDVEPVSKVMITNGSNVTQELEFFYNPTDKALLDSISGNQYSYAWKEGKETVTASPVRYIFGYNGTGQVNHLEIWQNSFSYITYETEYMNTVNWDYTYDEKGRLTAITNMQETGDRDYDITCSRWDEEGKVLDFGFRKDDPMKNKFLWEVKASGEATPITVWFITHRKDFGLGTQISDVVIPTYLPALPPVLATSYGDLQDLQCLLTWRYGVEKMHRYNFKGSGTDLESYDPDAPLYEMLYYTDMSGRLERMKQYRMSGWGDMNFQKEFIFVYE